MKSPYAFFVLFFLCSPFLNAQIDWELFPKNQETWWRQGDLLQLHYNDSTEVVGGQEVRYFGKRYLEAQFGECLEEAQNYVSDNFAELDYQLLAAEAMTADNNAWFQLTAAGDTAFFYPKAAVGFSWSIPSELPDVDSFQIQCTSLINYDFLGTSDSAKTFVIQAFTDGNPVAHPFNEHSFILSKHYGFLSFFPISRLTDIWENPFANQLTIEDNFNQVYEIVGLNNGSEQLGFTNDFLDYYGHFAAGEVYHWYLDNDNFDGPYSSFIDRYRWDSITQVDITPDSVLLTFDRYEIRYRQEVAPTFFDTTIITNLGMEKIYTRADFNAKFKKATYHLVDLEDEDFNLLRSHEPYFINDEIIETTSSNDIFLDHQNCQIDILFSESFPTTYLKPDIGEFFYDSRSYLLGEKIYRDTLRCYKKDGIWQGENCPDILSPVFNQQKTELTFRVFPNPVDNILNIKIPKNQSNNAFKITIINSLGQLILQKEINAVSNTVDVSNFPKGLYFLILENEKGFGRQKFLKE